MHFNIESDTLIKKQHLSGPLDDRQKTQKLDKSTLTVGHIVSNKTKLHENLQKLFPLKQ